MYPIFSVSKKSCIDPCLCAESTDPCLCAESTDPCLCAESTDPCLCAESTEYCCTKGLPNWYQFPCVVGDLSQQSLREGSGQKTSLCAELAVNHSTVCVVVGGGGGGGGGGGAAKDIVANFSTKGLPNWYIIFFVL